MNNRHSPFYVQEFDTYQLLSDETRIYPDACKILYPALLLASEAGEVAGKLQKLVRRGAPLASLPKSAKEEIIAEIGDALWACSALCADLGYPLSAAANRNLAKLADRQQRGVLEGSGDNR